MSVSLMDKTSGDAVRIEDVLIDEGLAAVGERLDKLLPMRTEAVSEAKEKEMVKNLLPVKARSFCSDVSFDISLAFSERNLFVKQLFSREN